MESGELLARLSESGVVRVLEPWARLQSRSAQLSFVEEVTKILAHAFAYAQAERVPGDYAEFGVWEGRTFVEAYRVAQRFPGFPRRFVAFDSFAGLPELSEVDAGGQFFAGQFDHDPRAFEARLRRARIPPGEVTIVEGFFEETLARPERIPLETVAVAWVDCDLYASTVPVLDYLAPRLAHGAVLIFDDWFCFQGAPDRGERRACAEWLERNPQISLVPWRQHGWGGQGFLVRRADAATPSR
ncbi:MAG: TylF/MycF/NovP-related O-methyltransferase [Thermoleophilaceae bacterium]